MKVCYLSGRVPWYGNHSGYYTQTPKYALGLAEEVSVCYPQRNLGTRMAGKLIAVSKQMGFRDQSLTYSEWNFQKRVNAKANCVAHVLNIESHLPLLCYWNKAPARLVGTIHFPASQWQKTDITKLSLLQSAIVLYNAEITFFEEIVGKGRVKFVHHGVDTEFFHPPVQEAEPKNILFAGHFLRDTEMLSEVILRLLKKRPDVRFHLLVDGHARQMKGLSKIEAHNSVHWHQKLTDQELAELYRNSYIMLLPMTDSGANNAVVEGLASGLPIVTTDVGGIRDYGGGTIFPTVPSGDIVKMIELVEQYLDDPAYRSALSKSCRAFAENYLDWSLVTKQHIEMYARLTGL